MTMNATISTDETMTGLSERSVTMAVRDLKKVYGTGSKAFTAIADLDFDILEGEFACIVGPSGAGKTTLLKCLSGLLSATSGEIKLHGGPVQGPPRGLAVVFQDYGRSLLPWATVSSNVAQPLLSLRVTKAERVDRTREALAAVGLQDAGEKYPWQLSGGMQQRVAIARALAYRPELLLMDEPFASVDAQTRADLEDLVRSIHNEYGITTLLVTHDIDETVYLADRVLVLSSSPARVLRSLDIPLGEERDQVATKSDPTFAQLRSIVYELVHRPGPPQSDPSW